MKLKLTTMIHKFVAMFSKNPKRYVVVIVGTLPALSWPSRTSKPPHDETDANSQGTTLSDSIRGKRRRSDEERSLVTDCEGRLSATGGHSHVSARSVVIRQKRFPAVGDHSHLSAQGTVIRQRRFPVVGDHSHVISSPPGFPRLSSRPLSPQSVAQRSELPAWAVSTVLPEDFTIWTVAQTRRQSCESERLTINRAIGLGIDHALRSL